MDASALECCCILVSELVETPSCYYSVMYSSSFLKRSYKHCLVYILYSRVYRLYRRGKVAFL